MWAEMDGKFSQNTCKLPDQRFCQKQTTAKNKLLLLFGT